MVNTKILFVGTNEKGYIALKKRRKDIILERILCSTAPKCIFDNPWMIEWGCRCIFLFKNNWNLVPSVCIAFKLVLPIP